MKERLASTLAANGALLLVALLLGLAVLEAGLRLLPNSFERQYRADRERRGVAHYMARENGFYTLVPNVTVGNVGACFKIDGIRTNEQGFRGPTLPGPAERPIVLLGDSFIEAQQVGEEEALPARLAALLREPVAGMGISGYSTVTEITAYRQFARPLKPRLVVLAFYAGNDVEGNSCKLAHNSAFPCANPEQGRVAIQTPQAGQAASAPQAGEESAAADIDSLKTVLREHLVLYQLLHKAKLAVQGLVGSGRQDDTRWGIYRGRPDPDIEEGWQITEELLRQLKQEVESDGAQLALLSIPEHLTLSPDWRRELLLGAGYAAPADFDPDLPARRLGDIAARNGVPLFDPTEALRNYRQRHGLPYPYFSFSCDGHLNPLGHELIANLLAAWLTEQALPASLRDGAQDRLRARLHESPETILGPEAFAAIYKGGVHRGRSNLSGEVK